MEILIRYYRPHMKIIIIKTRVRNKFKPLDKLYQDIFILSPMQEQIDWNVNEDLRDYIVGDYDVDSLLGCGNYGVVYKAIDKKNQTTVAMKVIPKSKIKKIKHLQKLIPTQIRVLKQCQNDNVIKIIDQFPTKHSIIIITQFCNGGDLQQYCNRQPQFRLKEKQAIIFLRQIVNGFKGLHEVRAMHRDFKLGNVLLHNNACKIADLGFAKQFNQGQESIAQTNLGTPLYMAPQILKKEKYGLEVDVWSLGVALYRMVFGDYPFQGHTQFQLLQNIRYKKVRYDHAVVSQQVVDFISKCLVENPKLRITWKQINNHKIIIEKMNHSIMKISGFSSMISMLENTQFYNKKSLEIDQIFINPEALTMFIKQDHKLNTIQEEITKKQHADRQFLQTWHNERKTINTALQNYEQVYLRKRNITLYFNLYLVPEIQHLYEMKSINHNLYLFLLIKKSYNQLLQMKNGLQKGDNMYNLGPYFQEFKTSKKYSIMIQNISNDLQIVKCLIEGYQQQLLEQPYCDEMQQEIHSQIDNIKHKDWKSFQLQYVIDPYFNLFFQNLNETSNLISLIKVVQGIYFYKDNSPNIDIQEFEKKLKYIEKNYNEYYKQLLEKQKKILEG